MSKGKTRDRQSGIHLGRIAFMPGGMFDLMVASLFINVLSLAMPLTLLQVYDRIVPNNAQATLTLLIMGVGTALILEALLRVGRSFVSGWMGARFEHLAGTAAMERLLRADLVDYERVGSGVHLERMNALNVVKEFYAGQAILAVVDLPFAVLFLALIAYLAGWLVWVPIVLFATFLLSAVIVGQKLKKSIQDRMQFDDRRFNFIIEVLGGIHTVKGLAMEEQMLRRYERLQETCAEADFRVALNSSEALGVGALFSQLSLFVVVGFGATLVIDGMLTVGGLAACTMLAGRSMQPLQRAVGVWTRFQTVRLARQRLHELFDVKPEAPAGLPDLPPVEGHIELDGVWFNYGKNRDREQLPDIFQDVNITVRPGETVGISGGNASGKTSLLYLMMGALRPTRGRVVIDGNDLSQYNPMSIRREIAYLPQMGVLFNGTIRENLTMFRDDKEEQAMEVARMLGLDAVVSHMALGYDTKVGDGAYDSLPRGIKQRIAIARALVDRPRVLLFDEANAAMDSQGDVVLRNFLERLKGRVTLVLVTPRPSLLKLADRVYDIEEGGRVVERREDEPEVLGATFAVAGRSA